MQNQKRKRESSSDLEERVLFINRCAKVLKGGRKFSFSALVVVGNRKNRVGVGFAKANEVSEAVRKAGEKARRNVFSFELNGGTIPHSVEVKKDGARILLKPAKKGTGMLVGGGQMRPLLELAGVCDVVGKSYGSNAPNNVVYATAEALRCLSSREEIIANREGEPL